jgi:hypothetical protein
MTPQSHSASPASELRSSCASRARPWSLSCCGRVRSPCSSVGQCAVERRRGGTASCSAALQWAWLPVIGNGNLAANLRLSASPCWQWTLSRRHNRRRAQIEQLPIVCILRRPVPRSPPAPRTAVSAPLPSRFLSRDWDGNAEMHTHLTSFAVYGPSQRHRQSLFPVAEATGSVSVPLYE